MGIGAFSELLQHKYSIPKRGNLPIIALELLVLFDITSMILARVVCRGRYDKEKMNSTCDRQ